MGLPDLTVTGADDILVVGKADDKSRLEPADDKKKKGKVVQRNYTLNDTGALKKKVKFEISRKTDFALGKEAKKRMQY